MKHFSRNLINISRFIAMSLVLAMHTSAWSWNAIGHQVIAQIAYLQLTPKAKKNVNALANYFIKEYPSDMPYLAMASWPDDLRSQKITSFNHWHYIDVPFSADGTQCTGTIDTDNAAWAIESIKVPLAYVHANPYERARFLAFAMHIIGDLHQPLHTTTRISQNRPLGDQGGNLFYVSLNHTRVNLHQLWDSGIGILNADNDVKTLATDLINRYPASFFKEKVFDMNVSDWEQEGMQAAKEYVYNTSENAPLSPIYQSEAKPVVEYQLALAGYRLAYWLNSALKN